MALAFEKIVLSRQVLGEENDFLFGQSLLLDLIEIWNHNIVQLKEDVKAVIGAQVLSELDANPNASDEVAQQDASKAAKKLLQDTLKDMSTIVICKTPHALKKLGHDVSMNI